MSHLHPAPASGNIISSVAVLAALPERLRSAFLAMPGDGFLKLEHNARVSTTERGEQLVDASRALTAARFDVWPVGGFRLEVSTRPAAPAKATLIEEACEGCGSPRAFACVCSDEPSYAEVA